MNSDCSGEAGVPVSNPELRRSFCGICIALLCNRTAALEWMLLGNYCLITNILRLSVFPERLGQQPSYEDEMDHTGRNRLSKVLKRAPIWSSHPLSPGARIRKARLARNEWFRRWFREDVQNCTELYNCMLVPWQIMFGCTQVLQIGRAYRRQLHEFVYFSLTTLLQSGYLCICVVLQMCLMEETRQQGKAKRAQRSIPNLRLHC